MGCVISPRTFGKLKKTARKTVTYANIVLRHHCSKVHAAFANSFRNNYGISHCPLCEALVHAVFNFPPRESYILDITLPSAAAKKSVIRSFTEMDVSSNWARNAPKIGSARRSATGKDEATAPPISSSCFWCTRRQEQTNRRSTFNPLHRCSMLPLASDE